MDTPLATEQQQPPDKVKTRDSTSVHSINPAPPILDLLARHNKYVELAEHNRRRKKYRQAQRCLQKAFYIATNALGEEHSQIANDLESLGIVLFEAGRYATADSIMACSRRLKRQQTSQPVLGNQA